MKTILYIAGIHSLLFALFHISFWKLFKWKSDLQNLTSINRGIMQILNTKITYLFLFIAYLCFFQTTALITTNLGNTILIAMSLFWLTRTIEQFIFIKTRNNKVYLLVFLFLVGVFLFLMPVLQKY